MGSFNSLNIGMTALFAQKMALDTTGQNIANAATPGYARQRVDMQAIRPQVMTYGAIGTGVTVNTIEHLTDEFLEAQVRTAVADMGTLEVTQDGYENIEVYFNELTENDLSSAFDRFWDSMQDWNNNIEDISTRRNVASEAQTLCDSFQSTRDKIYEYRFQQNNAIKEVVNDINEITEQIAVLNASIMKIEAGGATNVIANDLRDQRTELIKELSSNTDATITYETNGSVTVAQKGRMLVYQDQQFDLTTEKVTSGDMLVDRVIFADDGEEVNIEAGKLYGMIVMRDEVSKGFIDDLDQLAGEFIWNMNRQHTQGVGLAAYSTMTAQNEIIDANTTLDDIQFNFTPVEGTYQIKDGSFEILVYDESSDTTQTVVIDIDLDNVEDDEKTILANTEPTQDGNGNWIVEQPENSLLRKIQDALDSVSPTTFNVELDFGNQIKITSNADDVQFSFGRDTSGVLAALGLNTFFTGYNAESISVQEEYIDHPEYLAGASEFTAGNQDNAQALLAMRAKTVMSNNTASFEDYYQGIIGRLGIEGARIDSLYETQQDILVRVENQREDLSGVNLDEEMTKMMQFQKSYEAAAKFVTTVNSMYDSLLSMVQ